MFTILSTLPLRMRRTVVKRKKPSGSKLNKRQVRQVKSIVGRQIEHKTKFTTYFASGVQPGGTGGTIQKLTTIAQGAGSDQRTGDQIKLKQINLRVAALYADTYNTVRMIVFQWTPNDVAATAPVIGDILYDPTNGWLSGYNDTNLDAGKFRILLDRTYSLVGANYPQAVRTYRIFGKKIARKQITFNPTVTTGFNHIYQLLVSDSTAVPHPTLSTYCQVQYEDA